MKQFNVLEVAGIVSATLLIAVAICGSVFIVEYNKLSDKLNAADAVINECIDCYDSFYDTVGEGDAYYEYCK